MCKKKNCNSSDFQRLHFVPLQFFDHDKVNSYSAKVSKARVLARLANLLAQLQLRAALRLMLAAHIVNKKAARLVILRTKDR